MDLELGIRLVGLLLEGVGLYMTWRGVTALRGLGRRLEGDHVIHARPGVFRLDAPPYVTWEDLEKSEDMAEQRLDARDREGRARDVKVLRLLTDRARLGLILVGAGAVLSTLSEEIVRLWCVLTG